MSTNTDFNNDLPSITVDRIIDEFTKKLSGSFDAVPNHDSKVVMVAKIPEAEKIELDNLLANQGYEVSYKE